MRKLMIAGIYAAVMVTMSLGLVRSAPPKPGSTLKVRALKARLMRAPRFFGPSVTILRRGAKVRVSRVKGSWYMVSYSGRQGWVHKNRVTVKPLRLSSGATSGGATRGEAELAGRGFNPKVEAEFRRKNAKLDFSHVDRIQKAQFSQEYVGNFMIAGGLRPPKGGAR